MVARPFRHEAENRQLSFDVHVDPNLGRSIVTDSKRLQQVLKNLLSNAFKFTEQGGVRLSCLGATSGWSRRITRCSSRRRRRSWLSRFPTPASAFRSKSRSIIFEAFQQADAGTSRKYGGTGLGLAISRELASLLGGEIQLRSAPGKGSTFTLYLPQTYVGPSHCDRCAPQSEALDRPSRRCSFRRWRRGARRSRRSRTIAINLQPGDAILLIVEDDPHYARVLCRSGPRQGIQGSGGDARCGCAGAGAANTIRPRSLWTCSCPTCWAGRS